MFNENYGINSRKKLAILAKKHEKMYLYIQDFTQI